MRAVSGAAAIRLRVAFRGAVQGVGFRPFLYRLASELGLTGWVRNGPAGVTCEVEGPDEAVRSFLQRIPHELPPRAAIHGMEPTFLDPVAHAGPEVVRCGLRDPGQRHRRRACRDRPARHRDLRRLPPRAVRSGRSTLPLSLHELHELRTSLFDPRIASVRPRADDDEALRVVRSVPVRVRRSRAIAASTPSQRRAPRADPTSSSGRRPGPCRRLMTPRSAQQAGPSARARSWRSRASAAST